MRLGVLIAACVGCAVVAAWVVRKMEHRAQNAPALNIASINRAPATPSQRHLHLKFLATDLASNEEHDVAPKGPSRGDWALSRMRLSNLVDQFGLRAGAVVGRESLVAHLTGTRTGWVRGTTVFGDDTVIIYGAFRLRGRGRGFVFPIAGGSGALSGAKGTPYINGIISAHSEEHRYTITLPG